MDLGARGNISVSVNSNSSTCANFRGGGESKGCASSDLAFYKRRDLADRPDGHFSRSQSTLHMLAPAPRPDEPLLSPRRNCNSKRTWPSVFTTNKRHCNRNDPSSMHLRESMFTSIMAPPVVRDAAGVNDNGSVGDCAIRRGTRDDRCFPFDRTFVPKELGPLKADDAPT